LNLDSDEWFFIEMNPRIQVEHTVTEQITGVDLVRSQILNRDGHALDSDKVAIPPQDKVPRNGFAVQCRVTTETRRQVHAELREDHHLPQRGGLRRAARCRHGRRGRGDHTVLRFAAREDHDDRRDIHTALDRMDRSLREMRIRGVKTNTPFLENVINHPTFRSGAATTTLMTRRRRSSSSSSAATARQSCSASS